MVGAGSSSRPKPKRVTKMSDVELYENRKQYEFEEGAEISPHLPYAATSELQVKDASLFDFFRLVHFHGGRKPYLSWHAEGEFPITILSPVLKLAEGPSFAFSTRWALMQYHVWHNRNDFLEASDDEVKRLFRQWMDDTACPWYIREEYVAANRRTRRVRRSHTKPKPNEPDLQDNKDLSEPDGAGEGTTEIETSSDEETKMMQADPDADMHLFKMLYKGNLEEANRREEQTRKSHCISHKHNVYRNTRCTSIWQEEQSALAGGVINTHLDSDDDDAYTGEQKEIQRETQELRAVQSWINQEGWDAAAEGRAVSSKTGQTIDLRLPWDEVKRKLSPDAEAGRPERLLESDVLRDFDLAKLDPTQRAFADRVLKWARELVDVYKGNKANGTCKRPPQLRTWLCGSAGSGKSTTLKSTVQHLRLLFQQEEVDAAVELTAYTGVAAFNIGFGAKTCCSSFSISGTAPWKKELKRDAARKLEQQWRSVVLLIVDEISFIGTSFFAKMHFRLQQGRSRYFSERGLNPLWYSFGDASVILVGDFGQLEPIDDISLVDLETTRATIHKNLRHLLSQIRHGRNLLQEFTETFMLNRVHRSKDDQWWTESCLRLRDFTCTRHEDHDVWMQHDLDRGHLTKEQKRYFDQEAVWLCARCEDVGTRNGSKLRSMVEQDHQVVHKIDAVHHGTPAQQKRARKCASKVFEGLRDTVHLVQGCKVMLNRNVAYAKGLANGTRGKLVGIVYGPGGLGTLPEAIIVDFPDYDGERHGTFYDGEPTWVPILPMTSMREGTRQTRIQFPLAAAFALTVNKAQGLTLKEGVVIFLAGGERFRPASKHGLPFVAWTRSESFAMTAFKNLPSWSDFEKGRDSDMLRMRNAYTDKLWEQHTETMQKHTAMAMPLAEEAAHDEWRRTKARNTSTMPKDPPRLPCPACAKLYA